MLEIGQPFPSFLLPDQNGETHSSESLKGKRSIIYFYPKDDTPGCTMEACEFRDTRAEMPGVQVFGVSPDSEKSHARFSSKFQLNFPLLADAGQTLATEAGIWVEKSMYGKKYMGIERTTYLVNEDGIVTNLWRKVKPEGHAAEVKASLR